VLGSDGSAPDAPGGVGVAAAGVPGVASASNSAGLIVCSDAEEDGLAAAATDTAAISSSTAAYANLDAICDRITEPAAMGLQVCE